MFIYCSKCNWSQDDFWSENGYNPFNFLKENCQQQLFESKLEETFTIDKADYFGNFIGQEPMTNREFLVRELKRWAKKIKHQRWITYEQYKKENPERKCPICKNILTED